MSVIIQFWSTESVRMKSHRVDFSGICFNREDSTKCIIQSISFHNNRSIRNPMCENRGRSKSRFQGLERFTSIIIKIPLRTFARETRKQNNDVGVFGDKSSIEVCKA